MSIRTIYVTTAQNEKSRATPVAARCDAYRDCWTDELYAFRLRPGYGASSTQNSASKSCRFDWSCSCCPNLPHKKPSPRMRHNWGSCRVHSAGYWIETGGRKIAIRPDNFSALHSRHGTNLPNSGVPSSDTASTTMERGGRIPISASNSFDAIRTRMAQEQSSPACSRGLSGGKSDRANDHADPCAPDHGTVGGR